MQVYICEHCKRKMFSPGAMGLHEKQCKENPKNKHKCFEWCKHLEKQVYNCEDGGTAFNTKFRCKLQPELDLYSYKLERFSCHARAIKYMTRMPLECDLYQQYPQGEDNSIDFIF